MTPTLTYMPADEACRDGAAMVFGVGNDISWWDFFESGVSVVNIQCYDSTAVTNTIYDDMCADGSCCSPKCLSHINQVRWISLYE